MSRRYAACLVGLALQAGFVATAAADRGPGRAEITGLQAQLHGDEVRVSFRLRDAFPEEYRERLHSGIAVSFRHRVEMVARRGFFMAPNKLLGRTVVETKVEYDSLTRQYRLYRRTENRTRRAGDDPWIDLEVRRSTESLEEAVDWLTVLEDVPLAWRPEAARAERLRLRVSSNLGRRFILFVLPSSYSVSAELRLEF